MVHLNPILNVAVGVMFGMGTVNDLVSPFEAIPAGFVWSLIGIIPQPPPRVKVSELEVSDVRSKMLSILYSRASSLNVIVIVYVLGDPRTKL
jgi:hypothetical protein